MHGSGKKRKRKIIYVSHCVQIQVVHTCTYLCLCMEKKESHNIAFFVIALLQHRNTQRATNKPQAVTLIHKQCHDHWIIVTKLSLTVHLTLVHIARFYWTDSTGHSQKYREKIQNQA